MEGGKGEGMRRKRRRLQHIYVLFLLLAYALEEAGVFFFFVCVADGG